ncbi:MAG: aminotransferase class I/II-fold pyridoxal phosphate-dependent enzyme [Desulfuromonadaceae bacterium]|nr:aminotransferase class I/II-fold pyridoxal phosphate-dependent enzyme [Desulfuromonadaceae bacterium]
MNPVAAELNATLAARSPHLLDMLSELGQRIFFPKGILSQSAEAKAKAHRFNATIGIATEGGKPMYLPCIQKHFPDCDPAQLYPYAPPAGKPELRQLWREKMVRENPSLAGKHFSLPIVTNALTHGLSLVGDLFVEAGDHLVVPDQMWGNYRLTFGVRNKGVFRHYPFFNADNGFNCAGFRETLTATAREKGKALVLLNFPNNPTGYTPTVAEGERIVEIIREAAEEGCNIVAVTDDAYFGLFYEESLRESLFGRLANLHPRVCAIKIDGATKEEFVWGFRTGFLTFADGSRKENPAVLDVLEKKTMGLIRAGISNCPHPSQTLVLEALRSPDYPREKEEKFHVLQDRALEVKRVLGQDKFRQAWDYYPFNSGYFMCLKLKTVDAEVLRIHLLDRYGVGTIANNATDLRIAFSCIAKENIAELFDLIHQGVMDLS